MRLSSGSEGLMAPPWGAKPWPAFFTITRVAGTPAAEFLRQI